MFTRTQIHIYQPSRRTGSRAQTCLYPLLYLPANPHPSFALLRHFTTPPRDHRGIVASFHPEPPFPLDDSNLFHEAIDVFLFSHPQRRFPRINQAFHLIFTIHATLVTSHEMEMSDGAVIPIQVPRVFESKVSRQIAIWNFLMAMEKNFRQHENVNSARGGVEKARPIPGRKMESPAQGNQRPLAKKPSLCRWIVSRHSEILQHFAAVSRGNRR